MKKKRLAKKEKLISKWSIEKPLYIDENDKRYKRHLKELKETGFSDTETWSLYSCISEFILPRLKRFKEINAGYPSNLTEIKWNKILDKMIFSFEWTLEQDEMSEEYMSLSDKKKEINWKRYNEGMKLFAEYFRDLWW